MSVFLQTTRERGDEKDTRPLYFFYSLSCLVFSLLLLLTGCGKGTSNRADVEGIVNLNGAPLEDGSILFVPIEDTNGVVAGGQIQDGRYRLAEDAGVAIGLNRVEISSPKSTGRMIQQYGPGTSPQPEIIDMVATRFNSQSKLKVEVKPGKNTLDFDVESK